MVTHKENRKIYINLGCGNRYLSNWYNFDYTSRSSEIVACDIRKSIPLSDNCADLVYSSHFLEHLTYEEARTTLLESNRVLKNNGILRVVVPNLEYYVNLYAKSISDNRDYPERHLWNIAELIDQMVRVKQGGIKAGLIERGSKSFIQWLEPQANSEIKAIIDKRINGSDKLSSSLMTQKKSHRLGILKFLTRLLCRLKLETEDIQYINFLKTGEVHRWMYDEVSITVKLRDTGFREIKIMKFNESYISDWAAFNLDSENGLEYKPGSLYAEARK